MNCIVLFTKAPIRDQVKTRLVQSGSLNAEKAGQLYEAFLSDILETVGRYTTKNSIDLVVSYTPREGLSKIKGLLRKLEAPVKISRFDLQEETTFDQRMDDAFARAFSSGCEAVVVIGGDSPTIGEKHLDEAFRLLSDSSRSAGNAIVVGPGVDGGVYLIGLRRGTPFVFDGVFQKTDGADISLSLLEKRAHDMSVQVFKTSVHYDVDVPADMEILREELAKNLALAPHTRSVLSSLEPRQITSRGSRRAF